MAEVADAVVKGAGDAIVGLGVSLLLEKVLSMVQLVAEGNDRFRGLRILLDRLQSPTAYLKNHEDEAGGPLVHEWLSNLHGQLDEAHRLVVEWRGIKHWRLLRQQEALTRLINVTKNIRLLENSSVVNLASNVCNFDALEGYVDGLSDGVDSLGEGVDRLGEGVHKLGKGVDRLSEGVDRQGEGTGKMSEEVVRLGEEIVEVKTCLERLVSEVRSLTEERRQLAQATKDALAHHLQAAFPEAIEEIRRKARRTGYPAANLGSRSGPSRSSEAVTQFNTQDSFPDEVFGGNDIVDKVIAKILDGDYQKCIGLWNMGGAGKTFTVGRVYHDPRIQNYFDGRRHRIWVTVSKQSTHSVMEEIFMKLGGHEHDFPAADDIHGVRRALKGKLNRDKLLLVIDDVWENAQLDFIDLILKLEDAKRRVTLVMTCDSKILERKFATKIEMPLLSKDDSWKLFSRHTSGDVQVPSELKDVSGSVAAECKGLPLALKVIGSTLAGETNPQVWDISLKKLEHVSVLSKEHEEQVFGRLQLSIDNLCDRDDGDSCLQHCFYYFATYQEDAQIFFQDVVNMWMAEGIVGKDQDSPISPKNEAYELLGTLISLSMIEVQNQGFIYPRQICKIHDVMRDLARYNLENNFGKKFSITEKIPACQRLCLYRPGLKLATFPAEWTTLTTFLVERLSLMSNRLRELPGQFDAPHLRVLLLGRNRTVQSLPNQFFESFRGLTILDLQGTEIQEIPEAVFNSISLVLLNLDFCPLWQIPASIEHLQNLQQLRICHCNKLSSVPGGLRSLKALKQLDAKSTFIWDRTLSKDFATFQDVILLKSLELLSMSSNSLSQVSEISKLTALQSMELYCSKLKELPGSFIRLNNLKRLDLKSASLACLPAPDKLQHLEELSLHSDVLESFPDSFQNGAFPSLQSFYTQCEQLKCPILQQGAMPKIKLFRIRFSTVNLKNLSASFQVLRTLVYLEVSECMKLESLLAFEEPNSFPCLKEINLRGSDSLRSLPEGMLKSAPGLCRINLEYIGVSRSDIPEDLLAKEKLKQLEISFD